MQSVVLPSVQSVVRSGGAVRRKRRTFKIRAAKTPDGPRVAVVGVTGAVGQEFLKVSNPPKIKLTRFPRFSNNVIFRTVGSSVWRVSGLPGRNWSMTGRSTWLRS